LKVRERSFSALKGVLGDSSAEREELKKLLEVDGEEGRKTKKRRR